MECGKSFIRHLAQADEYFCYLKRKGLCKRRKNHLDRDLLCMLEELLCGMRSKRHDKCEKKCDK